MNYTDGKADDVFAVRWDWAAGCGQYAIYIRVMSLPRVHCVAVMDDFGNLVVVP